MTRHTFSILLLSACLGGGFVLCLSAGEPSSSVPSAAAPAQPRERALDQDELLVMLTMALQKDYVGDKGQLELTLNREWKTLQVPDEPLTVKILELPNTGVNVSFIVRFELLTADRSLGVWQAPLRAHVWRDIWVARSSLQEGTPLSEADVARERRDVLLQRSPLAEFAEGDANLEMAEPLQAGSPLLARSVRLRPVVYRGQLADALVKDGALTVSLKVQVLENGAPGQIVRARNVQSRRNLTGKVVDERTILVSL